VPRASRQDDAFFLRLLDFLPSGGVTAVLEAYFDESERAGGTFCVAGYAFAATQAKKFTKEWSRLFSGIKGGLHTVDLVHGRGAFAGTTSDERHSFMVEAVKIVNARMTAGVAISCNLTEVERHAPAWVCGFGHAYPLCCHLAMTTLGAYLDESRDPEKVVYIFESGHAYESEARRFMTNAVGCSDLKRSYRHHGESFLPKSDAVPLQAADLLAWEWAKFRDETVELPIRRMRKSFRELIRSAPKRYKVRHITGPPLAKFMDRVRTLGLFQMVEQGGPGKAP
jgi:hypothetical protein